jgi:hypothetical protein
VGLDPPSRIHCILPSEGSLNVERGQPALGQRCRGDLDEDAFVLRSQQIDLGDAGNAQKDIPRALGEVLQLRVGEVLAGNCIERDVGVAELSLKKGPTTPSGNV